MGTQITLRRSSCHLLASPETPEPKGGTNSRLGNVLLAAAVVVLVLLLLTTSLGPLLLGEGEALASDIGLPVGQSGSQLALNYTVYSPVIQNGSAKISYPTNYGVLTQYALSQIDDDRTTQGLASVNLSSSEVAQQHADSMLHYGYFSHFDTQGYKPYMRYTLLGGRGAVEENIATETYSGAHFTTTGSIESAIEGLEYAMMYNDSACCNNGHRYNILNPLHNFVSIGISYNASTVFFVEDFENLYMQLNFTVSATYQVTMTGTPLPAGMSPTSILIAYDPTPVPETPAQLNSGPHEYTPGTVLGGVLPPCSLPFGGCDKFTNGTTVYASTWKFTSTQTSVSFSLDDFIEKSAAAGVYTVYLLTGDDTGTALTSISVFITSSAQPP